MKYEIKYKCTYRSGWNSFPVLKIKYRIVGSFGWSTIERAIDEYAAEIGLYDKYDAALIGLSDSKERAFKFATVFKEQFNENMDEYVKRIVKERMSNDIVYNEYVNKANDLMNSWTTNEWKGIELIVSSTNEE